MNKDNYTINYGFKPLFERLLYWHRINLYKRIEVLFGAQSKQTILDIGSTADEGKASNIYISLLEQENIVTSISNQIIPDAVKARFPKTKFIFGNALNLGFADDSFDTCFSNATIEHVGNRENQKQFIRESVRVARDKTIILAPNRWFPIETHTRLPLIHFLPKNQFRKIIKFLGFLELSKEENLNLLSIKDIKHILKELNISNYKIVKLKFIFFTSNIALVVYDSKSFKYERK